MKSREVNDEESRHKILSLLTLAIPNKTPEEYQELYGVVEDILKYDSLVRDSLLV